MSSPARCSRGLARRTTARTAPPRSASLRAMAEPTKPLAPVTSAFPVKSIAALYCAAPPRPILEPYSAPAGRRPLIKTPPPAQGCSGMIEIVALFAVAVWVYLFAARGGFWLAAECDDRAEPAAPPAWPAVTAVIPARDEAATIGRTVQSL